MTSSARSSPTVRPPADRPGRTVRGGGRTPVAPGPFPVPGTLPVPGALPVPGTLSRPRCRTRRHPGTAAADPRGPAARAPATGTTASAALTGRPGRCLHLRTANRGPRDTAAGRGHRHAPPHRRITRTAVPPRRPAPPHCRPAAPPHHPAPPHHRTAVRHTPSSPFTPHCRSAASPHHRSTVRRTPSSPRTAVQPAPPHHPAPPFRHAARGTVRSAPPHRTASVHTGPHRSTADRTWPHPTARTRPDRSRAQPFRPYLPQHVRGTPPKGL